MGVSATKQAVLLLGVFLVGQNSFVAKLGELAQLGRDAGDHGPWLGLRGPSSPPVVLRSAVFGATLVEPQPFGGLGRRGRRRCRPSRPSPGRPSPPAPSRSSALPEAPDSPGRRRPPAARAVSPRSASPRAWRWSSVGGTDSPPTVFASPRPARQPGWRHGAGGQVQQRRGERLDRRGPFTRPGLLPVPAADDPVGVGTGQRADDVEGKRDDPEAAQRYVGGERRHAGRQVDENRDQVADRAQWVARRPPALRQHPAVRLGTAENACWMVLCALPAAVPVA